MPSAAAARTGTPCLPQVADAISTSGNLCSGQSGYSFWLVASAPTTTQLNSICVSGNCLNLVQELQKVAGTDECVTTDGYFLYQDILTPILKACASAKVETPTLPPSSASKNSGSSPSASSSGCVRVATLAIAALGVAQLALTL